MVTEANLMSRKKNFGLTWSVIKEVTGDSKESIKNWYEIWSGKK